MSLISIRNAVAPLTNTTHLVTIVLITVLFGVYRISGGTMRVSSGSDLGSRSSSDAPFKSRADYNPPTGDSAAIGQALPREPQRAGSSAKVVEAIPDSGSVRIDDTHDDLLQEMIGKAPLGTARDDREKAHPRRSIDQHGGAGGGLDDIEKTLGLK